MTVLTRAGFFIAVAMLAGCGPLLSPSPPDSLLEPLTAAPHEARRDGRPSAPAGEVAELARWLRPHTRHYGDAARRKVADDILVAARSYGLDPLLVAAVIVRESHFRSHVVSFAGAVGLMQVLPWVAEDVATRHDVPWDGPSTLRDPARNIRIGTAYLAELVERFDDTALALAAYNMGPTLLRARLNQGFVPRGPYVRSVMQSWRALDAQRGYERDFVRRTQRRFSAG